ncbi:MAG: peptidyl-prolyl cis-trans isomerase [Pseudomonadota bacterium]
MTRAAWIPIIIALLIGLAAGIWMGQRWLNEADVQPPDDWLAQIGERDWISTSEFEAELERRGVGLGGRGFSAEQQRALLNELIYRRALVLRAEQQGVHMRPEVRRGMEQIVVNQMLRAELRPQQEQADIAPEVIEAFYNEHADEYTVPARRRIAMIHFRVGVTASDETREQALVEAEQVRRAALALEPNVRDFGLLARDHSSHQASRYRGGVLGWIGEGDPARYNYPVVVTEQSLSMDQTGAVSPVLEDEDGLYLVRMVAYEPSRTRSLEELSDGIRQRLLRQRFIDVEAEYRNQVVSDFEVAIDEPRLAALAPDEPPAPPEPLQPPSLPASATQGN